MDTHHKPYLILQIDEHNSNIGYETRIEAGIRSFRNHAAMDISERKQKHILIFPPEKSIHARKTIIFPNWDQVVSPLLVANLRKAGLDARILEPDEAITRKSMEKAFLGRASMEKSLIRAVSMLEQIEHKPEKRPKVAIFGDLYVRDNQVLNQDLIHIIEEAGGEVITTPYHEYVKITAENSIRRLAVRGNNLEAMGYKTMLAAIQLLDNKYYRYFKKFLGNQTPIHPLKLGKKLKLFNIKNLHSGESYDNILKIFYILEKHPDVSLFVQTNPAFCCPSLVTEAMKNEIRRITGVPIVTITYDGTSEFKNDVIVPYMKLAVIN